MNFLSFKKQTLNKQICCKVRIILNTFQYCPSMSLSIIKLLLISKEVNPILSSSENVTPTLYSIPKVICFAFELDIPVLKPDVGYNMSSE